MGNGEHFIEKAQSQMQDYETGSKRLNSWIYLHMAETELMQAERLGANAINQYEQLRKLKGECAVRF